MPNYPALDRTEPNLARVTSTPDLAQMRGEMNDAITAALDFYDRNEQALNTRECYWEGQSADGRKHSTDSAAAFPWNNASDTRVRTADMVINERVMLKLAALSRMNVQIVAPQAKDSDFASRLAALLRWYLHNECADEASGEIELLAHYEETFGSAVLGLGWWQQLGYEIKTITIDEIAQLALRSGGPSLLSEVGAMLFDPRQEETTIGWIQQLSPLITAGEARRVLEQWRAGSEAEVAIPHVAENRPQLTALQTMQDVIFPVNTFRLQRSRWIAQRELLTAAELEARVDGREGWSEEFVKAVLDHPGATFNTNLAAMALIERQRELGGIWSARWGESDELFEVWHFFARATWRGMPTIMKTVLHPSCDEYWGAHDALEYAHGDYPHVEFVRERRTRSILSSRGWPELLATQQNEIKTQRDSRADRASITTLPPIRRKPRIGQVQDTFGPGVVVAANSGEIEPILFGAPDATSVEVERATVRDVNEYVGRRGEGVAPELIGLHEQHAVQRWLERWQVAGSQLLALAQQFTAPMVIGQVTGLIPKPLEITREAIAGSFRLMLSFDPRFTNTEWVFGVLERLERYVLPMDTNAVVNRDAVIRWAMAGIDPTLADLAVRDSEAAQQNEIEDELHNVALMVSGVEPPMKLKGQNFAARLNVLQQAFGANSQFFQALAQDRPDFQAIVQKRIEFLNQQVQQQKNRMIGVYGTEPSATSPGMAGMSGPGALQLGAFAMGGAR